AKTTWQVSDVIMLAMTLALLTYSYSIGRLLGPLFAAGLISFAYKGNRRAVVLTLAAYLITLLPLALFAFHNPGALTSRFDTISYFRENAPAESVAIEFLKHYVADINPWFMLVTGEANPRDHIAGLGSLLLPTFVF